MRLPREVWWIGGLTLLMFLLIVLMTGGKVERGEAGAFNPSTYSSDPQGSRALFLTLGELGYDARRLRTPFFSRAMPARGTLVIIQPLTPIAPPEQKALRKWIEQGHAVLLASSAPAADMAPVAAASPDVNDALAGGPLSYALAAQPSHLIRGVNRLAIRSMQRLVVPSPPVAHPRRAGVGPSPPTAEPDLSQVDGYLRSAAPVLRDARGTVAAYARAGKGSIILLGSPWSLSNEGIGKEDNLIFVLNALGRPGAAPVYFDEYHHGYGENLAWQLVPLPFKLAMAQLLLGVLIVMYARSRRLGSVVPLDRGRRERSEYLGTMTVLLQKGRATRLAVQTAYQAALTGLRLEMGLAHDAPVPDVVASASRISEDAGRKILEAVRQCESALGGAAPRRLSESRALAAVRQLDEAVRSIRQVGRV